LITTSCAVGRVIAAYHPAPAINARNDYQQNLADTPERMLSERHIEFVRQQGGMFVDAARVTRASPSHSLRAKTCSSLAKNFCQPNLAP
jgi:hypothetical protein